MRIFILGLLLAACAHQKVYYLGESLSVIAVGEEVSVRNEHPEIYNGGLYKGPLFMVRPGKDFAKTHCFEGFYNPREEYLSDSRAAQSLVQPFALCRDPEAPGDPGAFRLGLREVTAQNAYLQSPSSKEAIKQFQFTVRVVAAGATDVAIDQGDVRRISLPPDAQPFHEHPEFVGAMVTLGVLPPDMAGELRR
jgi:hypothetical protein